ncbi:hypothetical protein [uncultured Jatrophihabitans sp.]|uniref:hypothetical protein n=1 Tax=uncultured Jatrophihabitans sp. TaxID=1610747 RepID=UPI0035CBA515
MLSLVLALVYAAVLGVVLYGAVYHPLRSAPALARVGASAGLLPAFQAVAVIDFGTATQSTRPILHQWHLTVAGLVAPSDGVVLAVVTVVLAAVLAVVYRWTRFGLMTTALTTWADVSMEEVSGLTPRDHTESW